MTQSYRNARQVRRAIVAAVAAAFLAIPLQNAYAQAAADSGRAYDKSEVMIPMRDGVRLHTMILVPKVITEDLPIIMLRTPYGITGGERSLNGNVLAQEGYIFAFQDLRGRYTSEGQFEMLRPMRDKKDPKARGGAPAEGGSRAAQIDESTDAYDAIDWLCVHRHNPHSGSVGETHERRYFVPWNPLLKTHPWLVPENI